MGDVESRGNGSIAGTCPLLATQLPSVFPSFTFELPHNTNIIAARQGRAEFITSKDILTVLANEGVHSSRSCYISLWLYHFFTFSHSPIEYLLPKH